MANDININESAILETLNHKIDYDGGNYKGSGLETKVNQSRVSKTGDTITGDLTISKANTATFSVKSTGFDCTSTTAPASNISIGRYVFRDKAGTYAGAVEERFTTGNRVETVLCAQRKIGDAFKTAQIKVSVTNTGGDRFEFPRCTTKATTASTASNDKVAVVVQNYCNGTSWYRVWSDGWCEQGGIITGATNIALLKPFIDTNYTVVNSACIAFSKTATHLNITDVNVGSSYKPNPVGWEACGYIV